MQTVLSGGSSIDVKSTGTLSPSSSDDGISFCGFVSYANNTNVVNGVIETQTALDTLISDGYILPVGSAGTYTSNNTAYAAYKDFKFYIKTVNVINVGFKATITEPDNKNGIYKATRIALINSNKTTGLTSDNKYIVQSSVNPAAKIINSVYTESEGVTTGSYTLVSDAHLATEFGETSPSVFSVGVDYVTFYLRIWVEGNDPDCILENEVISPDLNVSIVFNVVE